jgi:hypothetical protein
VLAGKMQQLQRMINSHQGWDWNNPAPRGGNRHSIEIGDLWRAFANCQNIFKNKGCGNCKSNGTFGGWVRDLFPRSQPNSNSSDDLGSLDAPKRQSGPTGLGGMPFPVPIPIP